MGSYTRADCEPWIYIAWHNRSSPGVKNTQHPGSFLASLACNCSDVGRPRQVARHQYPKILQLVDWLESDIISNIILKVLAHEGQLRQIRVAGVFVGCVGHVLKLVFMEGHVVPFRPLNHIIEVILEELDIVLAFNGD